MEHSACSTPAPQYKYNMPWVKRPSDAFPAHIWRHECDRSCNACHDMKTTLSNLPETTQPIHCRTVQSAPSPDKRNKTQQNNCEKHCPLGLETQ